MKLTIKIIVLSFVSGVAGAFVFQQFINPNPVTEIIREVPARLTNAGFETGSLSNDFEKPNNTVFAPGDFREAAERSVRSVVYIKNKQNNRRSYSYLDYFFGNRGEATISTGSGVIYSEDGYIITNNHVIEGADEIEVMHEKRTYKANLVGRDAKMDIAVLKIEAEQLPAIKIGSSSQVALGDWVLAVGNPFNLNSTVTAGIVSAIGSETNAVRENFPIELYIQTDAAINPGNSGGALVNVRGELVGINTSIISKTGSYAGYGFAVPSDVVVKITEDLKKYKFVQKAYTGAELTDINEEVANREGLDELEGVFVSDVKYGSSADRAGLEPGDVILSIDGTSLSSKASFDEALSARSPGDEVKLQYKRKMQLYEAELVLENVFGNTEILDSKSGLDKEDIYFSDFLGAEMRKLTKGELESLDLRYGVKVTKINKRSGFLRKLDDIEEGYIITAINRRFAADPESVARYIEEYSGRIYIEVINNRNRKETLKYIFR